ncbi:hepatic and glial cell adhesion molecule-like [Heptranchias perlo]|uniref:hepatic and glial cell adhesion molecule-like n=1 Tax=Heptranchias perlo TaxID=212740 RepID=UPI00355A3C88
MLRSQGYLTSFIILLLGLLQGESEHTKLVTGFLHRPICLAAEENMNGSSLVQTISWQRGIQSIVEYQNTTHPSVMIFPKYKGRVTYITENNSLLIHKLSLQDEGCYRMTMTLHSGLEITESINLSVLVPVSKPSITVQTEHSPNPTLTMNCTIKSGSDPQFSWMKDNKILLGDQQFQPSVDHSILGVANLTCSDCGFYTCIVQNPINRVEAHQLITDEHFTECLLPAALGLGVVLSITAAVFCAIGFLVVFLTIKKYKERRRGCVRWLEGLILREQLSGEENSPRETRGNRRESAEPLPFPEEEILNEHSQTNMSDSGVGLQGAHYIYLHFIPSSGNRETEGDQFGYSTIGPRL